VSGNIGKEIWKKAIINSAINPLTAIAKCKNGYLLENPYLERLLEKICEEGIEVAKTIGLDMNERLVEKAKSIARATAENYSSMLQSIMRKKKTEIDSINGKIVEIGKKYGIPTPINEALVALIKGMESNRRFLD
jgi:2-dehydropantoate 2-reductase